MSLRLACVCVWITLIVAVDAPVCAGTTAFTYQGRLTDSGGLSQSGSYDMSFKLYDALTGGSQIGSTVTKTGVSVSGGVFSVLLDFGAVWNGSDRWLETAIAGTTLSPRVQVTPAPGALFSAAPWVTSGTKIYYTGGTVGIGTSSANAPLTIQGDGPDSQWIQLRNSSGAAKWHFNSASGGLDLSETGVADFRLFIKPGGNVGIGTDDPAAKLDVNGSTILRGAMTVNGNAGIAGNADVGGVMTIGGGSTVNGWLGIGTTTPAAALHVSGGLDVDQSQLRTFQGSGLASMWQSFTAGRSGTLVSVASNVSSEEYTVNIYQGEGVGGTRLSTQVVSTPLVYMAQIDLPSPVAVVAGQKYTFQMIPSDGNAVFSFDSGNPYAGGRMSVSTDWDASFIVRVSNDSLVVDGSATVGGTMTVDGSAAVGGSVTVSSGSKIGIGTSSPDRPLTISGTGVNGEWISLKDTAGETKWHINNAGGSLNFVETLVADRMRIAPGGYVGIGTSSISHRLQLPNTADAGGQAQANEWLTYSSARWKTNVRPIEDALAKVTRLQGVYYDWKPEQGSKHDIGFVAEDVGKVVPEVVSWEADGVNASGMDYARINALLVEAIKQQQKQIDDSRQQIERLEKLVASLLDHQKSESK